MITHVGDRGLACFYPEKGFVFAANVAEGPKSHAKGLGITGIRSAVEACAQLEDVVQNWPTTEQAAEQIEGSCDSFHADPNDRY